MASASGQLVLMMAAPLLARTYGPAEIGLFAVFMSLAAIVSSISCMRYEMTIPLVEKEAISTAVQVSVVASLVMTSVIAIFIFVYLLLLDDSLYRLNDQLWLLLPIVFMNGVASVGTYQSIRFGDFRVNAIYKFIQPTFFIILALLVSNFGLPLIYAVSFLSCFLFVYYYRDTMLIRSSNLSKFAREHRHYVLSLLPSTLMDASATALPMVFIGTFLGAEAAGHFSMVQRLTIGPLLVVSAAASQVFYGECSLRVREGFGTMNVVRKSLLLGVSGVAAWVMLIWLLGSQLIGGLLGAGWNTDVNYILLVTAPFVVRVIVSPMSTLLVAVNSKRWLFYWQFAYFLSCITVLFWGAANLDETSFLQLYGLHETLFYLVYLILIFKASRVYSLSLAAGKIETSCT